MKLGLIFSLSLLMIGCGSSPTEKSTDTNTSSGTTYNMGGGGGGGPLPCGRVYTIKFVTDAGTFTKEVPVYCNPDGDPYHGDPDPDHSEIVDPDPWDMHEKIEEGLHPEIVVQPLSEHR